MSAHNAAARTSRSPAPALPGRAGHATQVAYSGAQALEPAAYLRPEVALLGIGLPEMDGYELAQRLRALNETRLAPAGHGQAEGRRRAHNVGFDDHSIKPEDLPALGGALTHISAAGAE